MFLSVVIPHTHTHTQCLCISLSVGIKHACFSFVLFVDVVHTDMLTVSFVQNLSLRLALLLCQLLCQSLPDYFHLS